MVTLRVPAPVTVGSEVERVAPPTTCIIRVDQPDGGSLLPEVGTETPPQDAASEPTPVVVLLSPRPKSPGVLSLVGSLSVSTGQGPTRPLTSHPSCRMDVVGNLVHRLFLVDRSTETHSVDGETHRQKVGGSPLQDT